MRNPVSGSATISDTGTGTCLQSTLARNLLGTGIGTGKEFWLRGAGFFCNTTDRPVMYLSDISVTATAAYSPTAGAKVAILAPTELGVGGRTSTIEFKAPGLKFTTACVASVLASITVTGIYSAWGMGYEE